MVEALGITIDRRPKRRSRKNTGDGSLYPYN